MTLATPLPVAGLLPSTSAEEEAGKNGHATHKKHHASRPRRQTPRPRGAGGGWLADGDVGVGVSVRRQDGLLSSYYAIVLVNRRVGGAGSGASDHDTKVVGWPPGPERAEPSAIENCCVARGGETSSR